MSTTNEVIYRDPETKKPFKGSPLIPLDDLVNEISEAGRAEDDTLETAKVALRILKELEAAPATAPEDQMPNFAGIVAYCGGILGALTGGVMFTAAMYTGDSMFVAGGVLAVAGVVFVFWAGVLECFGYGQPLSRQTIS